VVLTIETNGVFFGTMERIKQCCILWDLTLYVPFGNWRGLAQSWGRYKAGLW
jgi:hypothetical protein